MLQNREKFNAVIKAQDEYEALVQHTDAEYARQIQEFEEYKAEYGTEAVIKKYKARPQKKTITVPPVHLDPQVKQELVCMILDTDYIINMNDDENEADDKGYTVQEIKDKIEFCIRDKVLPENKVEQWMPFYGAALPYYDIPEIIGSINKKLAAVHRAIVVDNHRYKGYDGLKDDFYQACILSKKTPINEKPFELTKGTITYDVMTVLRNSLAQRTVVLEQDFDFYEERKNKKKKDKQVELTEEEKKAELERYKAEKKQYVMDNLPAGPILCIENSVYNYVDNDDEKLKAVRSRIIQLAQAIINHRILQVRYFSVGMSEELNFEFHPHYIKQVGKRFICYGISRLMGQESEDEYKLVNIIISDIISMKSFNEMVEDYQSAESLGLDYNHEVFKDRMTYNAPKFNKEKDEPEEVVLKVRREIKTDTGYVKPYERILREPLHHSQKVAEDYGIDPEWGYIRLYLIDLMYITPMLLTEGSKIEVLKPERLRNLMAQKVKELALLYYPNLDFDNQQQSQTERPTI